MSAFEFKAAAIPAAVQKAADEDDEEGGDEKYNDDEVCICFVLCCLNSMLPIEILHFLGSY